MDNSFEDELSCPICYVNYQDKVKPIVICNNSHIVCDPCLWKMYIDLGAKLVCPLCKLEMENKGIATTHLEKANRMKMEESAKKKEMEEKEKESQLEKEREKQREKAKEMQKELERQMLQKQKDKEQESPLIVKNKPVQPVVRQDLQMPTVSKADKEKELRQINILNRQFQASVRIVQTKPISTFIPSPQIPTPPQVKFSFASSSSPNPNIQPSSTLQKPLPNKPNAYLP